MKERRLRQDPTSPARRSADYSWAAGLIEGEGACQFASRTIRLSVTNTDRRLLERLKRIFDMGNIGLNGRAGTGQRTRDVFHWRVFGANARRVYLLVLPYMIGKAEQIQALLALSQGRQGVPLTAAQREERAFLQQQLSAWRKMQSAPRKG